MGATTNGFGKYSITGMAAPDDATLLLYVWMDGGLNGPFGSETEPYSSSPACQSRDSFGCTNRGIGFSPILYPAPYPPQLVSPANGKSGVSTTGLVLRWTDGLDAPRRSWYTRYDIYGAGQTPYPYLYASDVPCNSDGTYCTFSVPAVLEPSTNYYWKVVAKTTYGYHPTYTASSIVGMFSTKQQPNRLYSFQTYYSYFLRANTDGSVSAPYQSIGTFEKWEIYDVTGGQLEHGDTIHLISASGRYMVAEGGGGGAVNASRTEAGPWETFTIWKAYGSGAINGGDAVNIRCWNGPYVVAEGGGGAEVNCNRENAAQWETFIVHTSN